MEMSVTKSYCHILNLNVHSQQHFQQNVQRFISIMVPFLPLFRTHNVSSKRSCIRFVVQYDW